MKRAQQAPQAQEPEPPRILTPAKAAKLVGVHPATIVRWIRKGVLKSFRTVGGHRRIFYSDLAPILAGAYRREIEPEPRGRTAPRKAH